MAKPDKNSSTHSLHQKTDFWHLGVKNNVILNIVLAAILLEAISATQFYFTRNLLADELERRAETELVMKAIIVKNTLKISENSLWGHLWDMERNMEEPDSLYDVMEWVLRSHHNITGCGVAFLPGYFPQKGRLFEPYAFWDNGKIRKEQVASDKHDYTQKTFYKRVMAEDTSIWIDPYYDNITDRIIVTYATPIHDNKNNVVAVFGIDVSTDILKDTLNYRHLYPSSYNILLTQSGELISAPDSKRVKYSNVEHVVNIINDSTSTKTMSKNGRCKIATFYDPDDNEKGYVYYATFKEKPDWQIAVVCYDKEVFGKLRKMHLILLLSMLAGIIVLGFIVSHFVKNSLKLKEANKAKERIDHELSIAKNIQMEMLPKTYPPYPERSDIDIYGSLVPAREVGGDLFDYFLRDEKLFFCIGDVSGKGVPAALLMAVIHTLFRSASAHENNPARILQSINETSCQGNESHMFVTLFLGVLDLPTGHLRYCNAGHDAPIIMGPTVTPLPVKANLPIGLFDDFNYEMQQTVLMPNSTMFLYTDGLTEAKNSQRKQFGLQRVQELLTRCTQEKKMPREIIETTIQEVHAFVMGAEPSDDLTLLAIHYMPQHFESILSETLTLKNDVRETAKLSSFMKSITEKLELDKSLARQLRLAVEEAVVNVIDYAYPVGIEGDVTIKVMSDNRCLKVIIVDSGVAFDPTAKEKTDITLSAEERQIGGLGILLVRELMDTINYERTDGQNILTLMKLLSNKKQ